MKKKDLTEASKRLEKMYPDIYTAITFTAEYDTHPGSPPKYSQKCGIYVKDIGYKNAPTFEECFAQL